ncbi:MAG: hypothetical protein M3P39_07720, partial [Actinomycetota bacterium]|nr:hypothetical protein [Actinomycetota bacterium]
MRIGNAEMLDVGTNVVGSALHPQHRPRPRALKPPSGSAEAGGMTPVDAPARQRFRLVTRSDFDGLV